MNRRKAALVRPKASKKSFGHKLKRRRRKCYFLLFVPLPDELPFTTQRGGE
ncbi:hypothetical protein T4C_3979 [Trichinella pseudospiralis]|uniref:Uncharacterized protein n=1 Tax=Trichinella pseudospiralis TaxID=6337 RepID=A0A0V1GKE4_TRIPS|nr:hypothetical protein T4C_3979 [Trichinella pseudospiralis]